MRKLTFILLYIACCLLFAGNGGGPLSAAHAAAAISVDRVSSEQWLCERSHNSDLNLPRTVGEVAPAPVERMSFRSGNPDAGRILPRAVFQGGAAGSLKSASATEFLFPSAVVRAVDYYVYRLRRLII